MFVPKEVLNLESISWFPLKLTKSFNNIPYMETEATRGFKDDAFINNK